THEPCYRAANGNFLAGFRNPPRFVGEKDYSMNSSCLPTRRSRSIFTALPGQRSVDRLRSFLCLVLCVLGAESSAQNPVVNGDFEAGQVAPWQGGELFANPSGGL